ncbi:MAG: hypothetical protein LBK53_08170 [Heliobacteriaceae bacterium]|jgi:hypothetical protein|nr:hypothetical protein [Heliobacteriaceae bacterium]
MNKIPLKQALALSALMGAVLGVLTLIPLAGKIAFFILLCFSSVIVIIFMLRLGLTKKLSVTESVMLGALTGFIAFIAFCAVYLPAVFILGQVFRIYSLYGVYIVLKAGSFWIISVLVIFTGVLSAVINAFSAFLTSYLPEFGAKG